ncbi:hypothetical protein COB64_04155 [Candidatus Wolfebacteria bacterium]|nr:MAG: hypothetical protein COB64_04155 [Candidatus Wolfebacteria bacterium]
MGFFDNLMGGKAPKSEAVKREIEERTGPQEEKVNGPETGVDEKVPAEFIDRALENINKDPAIKAQYDNADPQKKMEMIDIRAKTLWDVSTGKRESQAPSKSVLDI